MSEAATSDEQKKLLRQNRHAVLLDQWTHNRRRLSPEELAEISYLIDIEQPVAPSAPVESGAEVPALILTPDPPADDRGSAANIARWSEMYGTDRRALYRWIKIGKEHGYPCPLNQPVEMLSWWAPPRCKQRIPQKILDAARAAAQQTTATVAQKAAYAAPLSSPTAEDPAASTGTLDFAGQVEEMRVEQRTIRVQLAEARRGKIVNGSLYIDQSACESLQRQWLNISEPLRKSENDLTGWLEQRGRVSPTDEVKSEFRRVMTAVQSAVSRLVKSTRPQLRGKTDPEQDRIWAAEYVACFAALKATKFGPPPPEPLSFDEPPR